MDGEVRRCSQTWPMTFFCEGTWSVVVFDKMWGFVPFLCIVNVGVCFDSRQRAMTSDVAMDDGHREGLCYVFKGVRKGFYVPSVTD